MVCCKNRAMAKIWSLDVNVGAGSGPPNPLLWAALMTMLLVQVVHYSGAFIAGALGRNRGVGVGVGGVDDASCARGGY